MICLGRIQTSFWKHEHSPTVATLQHVSGHSYRAHCSAYDALVFSILRQYGLVPSHVEGIGDFQRSLTPSQEAPDPEPRQPVGILQLQERWSLRLSRPHVGAAHVDAETIR